MVKNLFSNTSDKELRVLLSHDEGDVRELEENIKSNKKRRKSAKQFILSATKELEKRRKK